MIYIRGTTPDAVRSGEWAHLFSIQHNPDGKDIWIVEFDDGATDAWPSWDLLAGYDVRVQIEAPEVVHDNQDHIPSADARASARALLAQRSTEA